MALRLLIASCMVSLMVLGATAWGRDGHRLTCMIAEPLLSSEAQSAINELLPQGTEGFADLCSWADDVKRSYKFRFSGPLHYVNTPDDLCGYDYDRDCHDDNGVKDICVSGAINNYTSQLNSFREVNSSLSLNTSSYNLTEALLFLAHYVGDIHQPLHVGFAKDAGGNDIRVRWFGRKSNLHHVWDTEFIVKAYQLYYHDIYKMSNNISLNITKENSTTWGTCETDQATCTDRYATDSIHAACQWAYKDASNNTDLADDYFNSRLPVVEEKLAQGGVRLASILNRVFSQKSAASR